MDLLLLTMHLMNDRFHQHDWTCHGAKHLSSHDICWVINKIASLLSPNVKQCNGRHLFSVVSRILCRLRKWRRLKICYDVVFKTEHVEVNNTIERVSLTTVWVMISAANCKAPKAKKKKYRWTVALPVGESRVGRALPFAQLVISCQSCDADRLLSALCDLPL